VMLATLEKMAYIKNINLPSTALNFIVF